MIDLIDANDLKFLFKTHFKINLDGKKLASLKQEGMPFYKISKKCHRYIWNECCEYILNKKTIVDIVKNAKLKAGFGYKYK